MAAASMKNQRKRSLRRLTAKNFLSNISLDGTFADTNHLFHIWKHHKQKIDVDPKNAEGVGDEIAIPESTTKEIPVTIMTGSRIKRNSESDTVNIPPKSITGRNTANIVSQPERPDGSELSMDKDKVWTPSKRWRTGSYSGDRDRISTRRRLVQLDSVASIRENTEKVERASRCSSSFSGESIDSHDHEIKYLSPDSRRRLKNERILIVSSAKMPFIVSSTLRYSRPAPPSRHDEDHAPVILRSRHHSGTKSISSQEDMFLLGQKLSRGEDAQDVSYSELLEPSSRKELKRAVSESRILTGENHAHTGRVYTRSVSEDPQFASPRGSIVTSLLQKVTEEEEEEQYNPNLLDDPELQSGGYRTVLNLSSYMISVIDYVKPSVLKKELNEKFKEKFPNIQLTLTKFRSLKKEMRSIGYVKTSIDLWTIAQAYVFFEKLILKLLITKQNRKLCAGACLMLSAKLNDIKGQQLSRLIDQIESDFRLHRKEMLSYEFAALVALEFTLLNQDSEIYPHYQRLLYQS